MSVTVQFFTQIITLAFDSAPAAAPVCQVAGSGGAFYDFAITSGNPITATPTTRTAAATPSPGDATGTLFYLPVNLTAAPDDTYRLGATVNGTQVIDPALYGEVVLGGVTVGTILDGVASGQAGGGTGGGGGGGTTPGATNASWLPVALFGGACRWLMGSSAAIAVAATPEPASRDDLILLDAKARLEATGVFGDVAIVHVDPSELEVDNGQDAAAWAWASDADEDTPFGPATVLREVRWRLTIAVREKDPGRRAQLLARMDSVARAALNNASLAGETFPARTRLGKGRPDPKAVSPEGRLNLEGAFTYRVGPDGNHNIADVA